MSRLIGAPRLAVAVLVAAGLVGATAPAKGQDDAAPEVRVTVKQVAPSGKARPCSFADEDARPIVGGCVLKGADTMTAKILTPFGRTPFATCRVKFTAHVEPDGEVSLEGIVFEEIGTAPNSPCGDIRACREATDPVRRPWLGQIEARASGGFEVAFDACLDTCAGWFEGPLVLALERVGGRWGFRGDRSEIRDTGFELTGSVPLEGPDLRLEQVED